MKKFMIGCAYTAVVLIVIGMVMGTVASRIKGRTTIEDVVESVTGGRVKIGLDPFSSWGIQVGENDFIGWMNDMDFPDENVWPEEPDFLEHIDESDFLEHIDDIGFDSRHSILRGNVDRYSLGSDIRELDFEVGACAFPLRSLRMRIFIWKRIMRESFKDMWKTIHFISVPRPRSRDGMI